MIEFNSIEKSILFGLYTSLSIFILLAAYFYKKQIKWLIMLFSNNILTKYEITKLNRKDYHSIS